jgi:hypothetical protein
MSRSLCLYLFFCITVSTESIGLWGESGLELLSSLLLFCSRTNREYRTLRENLSVIVVIQFLVLLSY